MPELRFHIEHDKLPKGLSSPLKFSKLQQALLEAGIKIEFQARYTSNVRHGFVVDFWPPNPNVPYERLYIVMGAVASENAYTARMKMINQTLPELVAWIRGILSLPENSPVRRSAQLFARELLDE
ncbi:MAG: hypothetical protein HC855_02460 [Rhizobiales bacterium]|nr:hypothetical protein [Hyphomicrobiales bacterium]